LFYRKQLHSTCEQKQSRLPVSFSDAWKTAAIPVDVHIQRFVGVKDTRKRWNHLLTLLLRRWPKLQGLRVFELHKEHGLHVHLLTNQFIDGDEARKLALKAGWGTNTRHARPE